MNGIKTISSDRSNLHEIASKQLLKNFRWLFFTINLYIFVQGAVLHVSVV